MNASLLLGTKAETLARLAPVLCQGRVAPLVYLSVADWKKDPVAAIKKIQATLTSTHLVVRSSAIKEDSDNQSHAGAFDSVLNVKRADQNQIVAAINKVICSYDKHPDQNNQILIQEQVQDVAVAGVVFTRDIDTHAAYYVINFDDRGDNTDSVTSGTGTELKTYIRFRNSPNTTKQPELQKLLVVCAELELLFGRDDLDIEFAITRAGEVYVLQVRPITTKPESPAVSDDLLKGYLYKIHKKAQKLNRSHPGLYGRRGMYSVMTDWNPAEMIGVRPRKLALSLYKELITDATWAYQRDNYGYKRLRSFPLLVSFLELPYIDVRVSLSSFVPAALDPELSHKLVDYYTECLLKHPSDHDKVEFNTVFSCYDLNLNQRLKKLLVHGFTELELDRLKFALLKLTNHVLSPSTGLYQKDLQKIESLKERYNEVIGSEMAIVDKLYWLIEDCKRYGTLPFAGLARSAFIAVQMLRSIQDLGIISGDEYLLFLNSLDTVARQLGADSGKFRRGELERAVLLERYGHLRPGTYDILSPRYDEAFESYFAGQQVPESDHAPFVLRSEQRQAISSMLRENGLETDVDSLFHFFKIAIEGREYGKFIFTRNLSQALVLLEDLGATIGLSREELSYLDFQVIKNLYATLSHEDLSEIFHRDIEANRRSHIVAQSLRLPQLITSADEVYDFYLGGVEPNFITLSNITQLIVLEDSLHQEDLRGKIIFIRSADPGYDWIFSRNIGGLITMYGGANSHMAIRCAELKIPAVIGCGEQNYAVWSKSRRLEIDCVNKQVRVV